MGALHPARSLGLPAVMLQEGWGSVAPLSALTALPELVAPQGRAQGGSSSSPMLPGCAHYCILTQGPPSPCPGEALGSMFLDFSSC